MNQNLTSKRIVCFGELLIRLEAPNRRQLFQTPALNTAFVGAEANVAVSLAYLGHDATVVTTLPANRIGDACMAELRRHSIDTHSIRRQSGRMALYFISTGAMMRPSEIIYDRAGSVFSTADPGAYDWKKLLDGADWLHVSGITPALGEQAATALNDAIAAAESTGVKISFDCNFRPSLWRGREKEAAAILRQIAQKADLLFGGVRDAAMLFGKDFTKLPPHEGFNKAAQAIFEACPQLEWLAATHRTVHGADHNDLTGFFATRTNIVGSREFVLRPIVDRIGAGDAFAAGILHGLRKQLDLQQTIDFATAATAYKHSLSGDFNTVGEADILNLLATGGGDVSR